MPVRQAIEQGLDIITEQLAGVILAVQKETGVDEDELDEEVDNGVNGNGMDPQMGGMMDPYAAQQYGGATDGYGGQGGYGGGGGYGMSPLRR